MGEANYIWDFLWALQGERELQRGYEQYIHVEWKLC